MAAAAAKSGRFWRLVVRSLHTSCRHAPSEPALAPEPGLGLFNLAAVNSREVGVLLGGLRRHGMMPSWNVDHGIRWMSSSQLPRARDDIDQRPRKDGEEEGEGDDGEGDDVGTEGQIFEEGSLQSQLLNAPRRKRRYLMERALKIRSPQTPAPSERMEMKVIDVNRTCKVTKGGGVMNFTAFVICGNNNGVVGFGKGKSTEVPAAVDKAYLRAMSNLHYFERYQGHTIYRPHDTKFGKTKIYLWPAKAGVGMRASHTVGGILRLAGFKDVKTKIVGSRHPHNTVKAVFKALSEIEAPDDELDGTNF